MTCNERREQLSQVADGEPGAAEQGGLFGHLEGCVECRAFLEALMRVRGAVRVDRERLLREADALLPDTMPVPTWATTPVLARAGAREREGIGNRTWREAVLPAPMALGFAALVLAVGIAVGAGIALRVGRTAVPVPGTPAPALESRQPAPSAARIVYVSALPRVEVVATPLTQP